ncbi:hypothetical protein L1987_86760 [Smallanthus sonchifolius]|uniref:Uncharacterized protein n=1 Tax=Smallanthus sonchifolius TaxID=185202 RepID=A0ACB8XZH7_9ASTR|nr:hypothetical protein L1987_86760 [Smallanthus sonchifolius]
MTSSAVETESPDLVCELDNVQGMVDALTLVRWKRHQLFVRYEYSAHGRPKFGTVCGLTHISTKFAGTRECAAPEYIEVGHLTSKSDVWSYGVFLYELITGRRPQEDQKLLDWVIPYLDTKKFMQIIDPRLEVKVPSQATTQDPPRVPEEIKQAFLDPIQGYKAHADTKHESEIESINEEVPQTRPFKLWKSCFK